VSLASRLREANASLFQASLDHPFVTGIGDGTLPREVFARWIVQDWLYLQGYLEALEAASRLAMDDTTRAFWRELARLTREVELDLHRGLARRFGLSIEALDEAAPFEATTDYLTTLEQACTSYPTLVATLTPCAVGYAEIARALDARGTCTEPDYAAWIATYTDPAFQDTVRGFAAELDRCGALYEALPDIEQAYTRAARCELAFWEGLWRGW
jgi:thiaminase (transcriptional activator TenA)